LIFVSAPVAQKWQYTNLDPSPVILIFFFIAFCPQPKAGLTIPFCRCLSREKKRYFGRFYDEGKELKFREVGGIKMSCGSDRAEFVDSTAQKPVLQWFYRII
jgi:hypothetical protein